MVKPLSLDIPTQQEPPKFQCRKIEQMNPFLRSKNQNQNTVDIKKPQEFPAQTLDSSHTLLHSACVQCRSHEAKGQELTNTIGYLKQEAQRQQQILVQQQSELKQAHLKNQELAQDSQQKQNQLRQNVQQLQHELTLNQESVVLRQFFQVSSEHMQQIQDLSSKLSLKRTQQEKQCKKIKQQDSALQQMGGQLNHAQEELAKLQKTLQKSQQDQQLQQKKQELQIKELREKGDFYRHAFEEMKLQQEKESQEKNMQIQKLEETLVNLKIDSDQKDLKIQKLKSKKEEAKTTLEFEMKGNQQKHQFLSQESLQNKELLASLQGENNVLQEKVLFQDQELQELRKLRTLSDQSELIQQIKNELKEKKEELEVLREKYESFLQGNFLKLQQEHNKQQNQAPIYIEKEKPVYIEKPIYIDRVVEKEVPVDKIVEKIVYRDKRVEVPVYVDKVVEKPVYIEVEKQVPIDGRDPQQDEILMQKIQHLVEQNRQKIEEIKQLKLQVNELEFQLKFGKETNMQTLITPHQVNLHPQVINNQGVSPVRYENYTDKRGRSPSPLQFEVPRYEYQAPPVNNLIKDMDQIKHQVLGNFSFHA